MRQTKDNAIKLLAAMRDNTRAVARDIEPSKPQFARELRQQASGLQSAIWLLTEPNFFNKIAEIHFPSENE